MEITIEKARAINAYPYNGTPDRIIEHNKDVLKSIKIKFCCIYGWEQWPVYLKLNEIDPSKLVKYNDTNKIYLYMPNYVSPITDNMGIVEFELYGACSKKKEIYLILKNINEKLSKYLEYFIIQNDALVMAGDVFPNTLVEFDNAKIDDFYKGYRNSKWQKLDPKNFTKYLGKVIEVSKNLD
jgi:hypothetical protein